MKHISRIIILLLAAILTLPISTASIGPDSSRKEELRGVWVASVINIDYPSMPTVDSETLKNEAVRILDKAEEIGINAVFLQVRPTSDALYKSKIFPWSKYLTGSQGLIPSEAFDPLAYWVDEAHKRGIELHAWINPYRITKKKANEPKFDFSSLAASNPAMLNPDWVVKHSDGNLYYNPGIPEVRELVINGVMEIVQNYDIDGVHFDDYFYPDKNFEDKDTYAKYGTGYGNIDDWRRANVDALIHDLSEAIKTAPRRVRFGVSPSGIWANKNTNAAGSDTKGKQSYYDQYADTRKWVKEGLIDYIAPQIYWNIGFGAADYAKLLTWWKNTVAGTDVDLYIGQAAYRSGDANPKSPWYGVSELEKQLQLNFQNPEVKGSIFFSNKSLMDNPALASVIKAIYEKRDGLASGTQVSESHPLENIQTSFERFYLYGTSEPGKPLLLNGKPIENRSAQGHFGILVNLAKGPNVFTFSQEGAYSTRVIYRETDSTAPVKMSKAEIFEKSVFPQQQEYRTPGEKITLSCKAPMGSKVTVKIGGKSYTMKPSTASKAAGLYADTYTYTYIMPSYTGAPRNVDLGAPVYTMKYKGIVKTRKAPAKVGVIMQGSPFYASVSKSVINTYQKPSTSDGAAYEIYGGMADYVTGMTGSYVRLSIGQWVNKSDVKIYNSKTKLDSAVKNVDYVQGEWWSTLNMTMTSSSAAIADFDGNTLHLSISPASTAALPALPDNSIFSSVKAVKNGNIVEYALTLKSNQRIEGYYLLRTSEGLQLNVKNPVKANMGNEPLAGISIMLDPGHGGSDNGALGPLGTAYPEKTINLNTALKLQTELAQLGARVIMTRSSDKNVSLEERLSASRNTRPDMFISIHANSMEDNVDISKVDGFSVFYRENTAETLAESMFNNVIMSLNRNNKGVHAKNFYVLRGTWTPSILIESGFVPNPNEFEWLTDEGEQARLAKSISEAVLGYFRQ